jgi:hypothetical protein
MINYRHSDSSDIPLRQYRSAGNAAAKQFDRHSNRIWRTAAPSSTGTATCSNNSTPPKPSHPARPAGPAVSRASLQADLLAAQERAARLAARVRQLEHRLSELLGHVTCPRVSANASPLTRTRTAAPADHQR